MKSAEYNATKQELIQWIKSLSDTSLLDFLYAIRMLGRDGDKDWWEKLSDLDKSNIELGLSDLKKGKVVAPEIFWERLKNG